MKYKYYVASPETAGRIAELDEVQELANRYSFVQKDVRKLPDPDVFALQTLMAQEKYYRNRLKELGDELQIIKESKDCTDRRASISFRDQ